ncbi:PP2AA [Hepatospora eriocheir]|uniref:PP2AA n=1 Tax=Hepatospora eriocheir TaxID=1081669 RepID=A0A1X0QE28_9MICR|nr:PP2AA [Hepatospora eriocheir]
MVEDGYSYNHDKACVTIFTAPNYCYRCGNLAAFMNMNGTSNYQLTQFEPSPENEPELMKSFSDYFTF